jgi:dTDP-4-dehydrorhamnose 3,5-epimerase-like enzyme
MNLAARLLLAAFLLMIWAGSVSAQRMFSLGNNTANVSASTTTASVALVIPTPAPRNMVVRVYNAATTVAFVNCGAGSATAVATTSLPVAAGAASAVTVPEGTTHCAAILGTGTGTVYFTVGEGIL